MQVQVTKITCSPWHGAVPNFETKFMSYLQSRFLHEQVNHNLKFPTQGHKTIDCTNVVFLTVHSKKRPLSNILSCVPSLLSRRRHLSPFEGAPAHQSSLIDFLDQSVNFLCPLLTYAQHTPQAAETLLRKREHGFTGRFLPKETVGFAGVHAMKETREDYRECHNWMRR